MTLTEIANGLRIDKGLASRYARRGMPLTSVEDASAWKAANIRPRISPGATKRPKKRAAASRPEPPAQTPYEAAKARTAMAEAEDRELALLERKGILVRREAIRAELGRRLSALKDALLQIPARLQSVLAAETDEAKVHQLLEDELYLALAAAAEVGVS